MKRRPTAVPETVAPAATPKPEADVSGDYRIMRARDLKVIRAIQRKAPADRIRKIGLGWMPKKAGTLFVALITDGPHKGTLHIYDGGTRHEAVMLYVDPDYLFRCVITPMTMEEAAQAFLDFNGLSQKPSAFSRYQVGIQAHEPVAMAIKVALAEAGVEATPGPSRYGNGDGSGQYAAFAAAERVIKTHYGRGGSYEAASSHLAWCLGMTRAAWPQHGFEGPAQAHDADAVQAVSYLGLTYEAIVGDDDAEAHVRHAMTSWMGTTPKDTKLFANGESMTPERWRVALTATKANNPGSASRGYQIGALIALNHNRGYKSRLRTAAKRKR